MLLSELKNCFKDFELYRDGEFNSTGSVDVTFFQNTLAYLNEKRFIRKITADVSCIITTNEFLEFVPGNVGVVISKDPKSLFWEVHNYLAKRNRTLKRPTTIGENTTVHPSAVIAENNVVIGMNTIIKANAVIMEDVVIGDNCTIHPGVVIGDEGFQYQSINGELVYIEHCGGVKIGNNVQIHACSEVAKALWKDDNTLIEDHVKIDGQVHIAHGAKIKRRSMLIAGTIVGGGCVIGEGCFLGINCATKNLVNVSDNVLVGMGAVVIRDVPKGATAFGNPAHTLREHQLRGEANAKL